MVGEGVGGRVGLRTGAFVGRVVVGIRDGRIVGFNVVIPPDRLPSRTTLTAAYPGTTSIRIAST